MGNSATSAYSYARRAHTGLAPERPGPASITSPISDAQVRRDNPVLEAKARREIVWLRHCRGYPIAPVLLLFHQRSRRSGQLQNESQLSPRLTWPLLKTLFRMHWRSPPGTAILSYWSSKGTPF